MHVSWYAVHLSLRPGKARTRTIGSITQKYAQVHEKKRKNRSGYFGTKGYFQSVGDWDVRLRNELQKSDRVSVTESIQNMVTVPKLCLKKTYVVLDFKKDRISPKKLTMSSKLRFPQIKWF